MSYTGQNPATDGQLTSGDPQGASSCVAYSYSYACDDATLGAFRPSGQRIRDWTHDNVGGLELSQCEVAVESHSNAVEFTTTVLTRAQFYGKLVQGFGMVLLVGYKPFAESSFSGQPSFFGNHAIYVPPNKHVMDPLADGRRPGIYKYHDALYPDWLLDLGAAALRLGNGRAAGAEHFEVSFVKVLKEASLPAYRVRIDPGIVGLYKVSGRTVVGNPKLYNVKSPAIVTNCTRPKTYLRPGHPAAHLVRLVGSRIQGQYVSVNNYRVHVEER